MARLDLIDVIRARLMEAGIEDVYPSMPDMRKVQEACVLTVGTPEEQTGYFDLTFSTPIRVTLLFSRIQELDAMSDALEAERVMRTSPLDSANGSYEVHGVETQKPRPVLWDESGRNVWAFDAIVNITMKEV